ERHVVPRAAVDEGRGVEVAAAAAAARAAAAAEWSGRVELDEQALIEALVRRHARTAAGRHAAARRLIAIGAARTGGAERAGRGQPELAVLAEPERAVADLPVERDQPLLTVRDRDIATGRRGPRGAHALCGAGQVPPLAGVAGDRPRRRAP